MIPCHDNRRLILAILILSLFLTTSCAKGAGLDRLTHKEALVRSRKVLVNRFTNNVNYYWTDGRWEKLRGTARATLQALYEGDKTSR